MITTLAELTPNDNFTTIVNKKKDNVNQIIDCINKIVERITELETTIYNNKIKELRDMKMEKYDIMKQSTKQVQILQPIKTNGKEMDIIKNSMNVLKEWLNKNTFNVIFDSDIDGDGSKNVLHDRVFNKSNLYFIHFDENNNVFGGYLNTKIDKSVDNIVNRPICDENSFVFSLIRNGKVNNKRYFLEKFDRAFWLMNNRPDGWLYGFGLDINVYKVGSNKSSFGSQYKLWYDYKNDNKPLTDITYPNTFTLQRIVVLEVN